jgi:hypothetical protein
MVGFSWCVQDVQSLPELIHSAHSLRSLLLRKLSNRMNLFSLDRVKYPGVSRSGAEHGGLRLIYRTPLWRWSLG